MAARSQEAKWQTVKGKDDRKQKSRKAPDQPLPAQQQANRAFAAIDSDAEHFSARGGPASTSAPSRSAFASLETNSPPPSPVAAPAQQPTEKQQAQQKALSKPAKAKKPAVKKQAQPAPMPQLHISTEELRQVLQNTAEKYRDDQLSQLETVADFFVRSLKDTDLGMSRLSRERTLHKATDTPFKELPQDLTAAALRYLASIAAKPASQFQLQLIDAALAGLPDGKGQQNQHRVQAGVLAMLALLARASPDALLLLQHPLLSKASHYCSPAHLSFLLWTFAQAGRSNAGVGLAMWLHVLLPVFTGSFPSPDSNSHAIPEVQFSAAGIEAALGFLEEVLNSGKPDKKGKGPHINPKLLESARKGIHCQGTDKQPEPVVPPAALEAIIRPDAKNSRACPPVVRIMLVNQHDRLLQLALAGIKSGGYPLPEAVRLALETASLSEAPLEGTQDAVADEAASHLASYLLAAFPAAAAAWKSRHKHQLRGSARVLQCWLARRSDPQVKDLQRRKEFRPFLEELRQRHASTLGGGRKGTHGRNVAAAAESACVGLLSKSKPVKGSSAGTGGSASTWGAPSVLLVIVLVIAAGFGLSKLDGAQEYLQRVKSSTPVQSLSAAVHRAYAASAETLVPLQPKVERYVQPVVASSKEGLRKAQTELAPVLAQLQQQGSSLLQKASAYLAPYVSQVSARVSALVHWRSSE